MPLPKEQLVYVNNTSNVHLDIMRPTMLFSGLEVVVHNQNRQQANLRLFEFGKSYLTKEGGGHKESQHLTLFLTGQKQTESWQENSKEMVDFYMLKSFVTNVLNRLGVAKFQEEPLKDAIFSLGYRFFRGQQMLASFGKVQSSILKEMGIKNPVFYADINFDSLLKATKKHKIKYDTLNKFPTVRRDLALVINNSVTFGDIERVTRKTTKKNLQAINLFDVYQNEEQLGAGMKSYAVSFIFEDKTKTLKDKEVDKDINRLIKAFEETLGAQIRR